MSAYPKPGGYPPEPDPEPEPEPVADELTSDMFADPLVEGENPSSDPTEGSPE
jgi:hypothetical protein